jgi:hypothetical protein
LGQHFILQLDGVTRLVTALAMRLRCSFCDSEFYWAMEVLLSQHLALIEIMLPNQPDPAHPSMTLRQTIEDQWRRATCLQR